MYAYLELILVIWLP